MTAQPWLTAKWQPDETLNQRIQLTYAKACDLKKV